MEHELGVFSFVGERLASIADRVLAQGVRPTLMLFLAGGILLRLARWAPGPGVRRRALVSFAGVFAWYVILEIVYEARIVGSLIMTLLEVIPLAIAIHWVRRAAEHGSSSEI